MWLQVSNLLVTVNSSVNLFVYCVFGERFRNELKKMIRPLARRVKKAGHFCGLWWLLQQNQGDGTNQGPAASEEGLQDGLRSLAATETIHNRRDKKVGETELILNFTFQQKLNIERE